MARKHTDLVKAALADIKALLDRLGDDVLSRPVLDWFEAWDGEELEELDEFSVETANGPTITVEDGTVTVGDDTDRAYTTVRIDNVVIVMYDGKKGGSHGSTYTPKDSDDPVVVLLDEDDIDGSEIALKIVLLHELVHVRQVRDLGAGDTEVEAEAHLNSMFICALVLQQHPASGEDIEDLYKTAKKKLDEHADDVDDENKSELLRQILATKAKLREDIAELNASLEEETRDLEERREDWEQANDAHQEGLPEGKRSKKRKKKLERVDDAVGAAAERVDDFEKAKTTAMETDAEVAEELAELVELEDELTQAEQDLEQAEGDERRDLRDRIDELKGELRRRRRDAKRRVKREMDRLEEAAGEADAAGDAIDDAVKKLGELLRDSRDDDLTDAIAGLLAALRKCATRLELLEFKLEVMVELERQVRGLL